MNVLDKIKRRINFADALQNEEFVTQMFQSLLEDKKVREDLLNLLSFTPDDNAEKEGRPGSREAKSWVLRMWWRIMYKPIIGEFMKDVIDRHNKYWVKRDA